MRKDWIKIMKQLKTMKLSKQNLFRHYSIVPFLLIGPAITTWNLFEFYILDTYMCAHAFGDGSGNLSFYYSGNAFYIIQCKRLKFEEFKIMTGLDEFKISLEKTAKELEWTIDYLSYDFVRGRRSWNWSGCWGEMITVIRYKDSILINSICDPDRWMSVASWGWNMKNVKTLVKNIKKRKL